ncbi:unnamed protein product [Cuscuta epithymum]|uniref:Retrotransposon Copia-like N-terminal domain-containing protein n=1 Tax=Cuscuta epithymum TaxID=186058 RepID=A0AAV0CPB0_9ASTE|nr:unnamed protein product [Cuscuta epithymum]
MAVPADSVPIATMVHMVTIKLSSTNFLLWKSQVFPMLTAFDLLGYVNGTISAPSPTITTDSVERPNPAYTAWQTTDQKILGVLFSTLTEESMVEVVGCTTSRAAWLALENTFAPASSSRANHLRDELMSLRRGSMTVADYGRKFQNLCNNLAEIGRPVDESDKSNWFLRGLGPQFTHFADNRMSRDPIPSLRDLVNQAQQYDLFIRTMEGTPPPSAAFYAHDRHPSRSGQQSRQRGTSAGRGYRDASSGHQPSTHPGGRARSSSGSNPSRRPYTPRCQICQGQHYADKCPQYLQACGTVPSQPSAQLAEAFQASCNLSEPVSDWYVDTGASAHMTSHTSALDQFEPYSGNAPGDKSSTSSRQV